MSKKLFDAQVAQYALQENEDVSRVSLENGVKCKLPKLELYGPNRFLQTINGNDYAYEQGVADGTGLMSGSITFAGESFIRMSYEAPNTMPRWVMMFSNLKLLDNIDSPQVLSEWHRDGYVYQIVLEPVDSQYIKIIFSNTRNNNTLEYTKLRQDIGSIVFTRRELSVDDSDLITLENDLWDPYFWDSNSSIEQIICGHKEQNRITPSALYCALANCDIMGGASGLDGGSYYGMLGRTRNYHKYGIIFYNTSTNQYSPFFPVSHQNPNIVDECIEQYYIPVEYAIEGKKLLYQEESSNLFWGNNLSYISPYIKLYNNQIDVYSGGLDDMSYAGYLTQTFRDILPDNIALVPSTYNLAQFCPTVHYNDELWLNFDCNDNDITDIYLFNITQEPNFCECWTKSQSFRVAKNPTEYFIAFGYDIVKNKTVTYTNLMISRTQADLSTYQPPQELDLIDLEALKHQWLSPNDVIIVDTLNNTAICKSFTKLYTLNPNSEIMLMDLGTIEEESFFLIQSIDGEELSNKINKVIWCSHLYNELGPPIGSAYAHNNGIMIDVMWNSYQNLVTEFEGITMETMRQWLLNNKVSFIVQLKEPVIYNLQDTYPELCQQLLNIKQYKGTTIIGYEHPDSNYTPIDNLKVSYLVHSSEKRIPTTITSSNSVLTINTDNKNIDIININDETQIINIKRGGVVCPTVK